MNKRGKWTLWMSVVLVLILVAIIFLFFALYKPSNAIVNTQNTGSGLVNPVGNLTNVEAINKFDESFVYYILYEIKAYNLHNPPLSKDQPKLEFEVEDRVFNAVIDNGKINVGVGEIDNPDAIIHTTKEEGVSMLRNSSYIKTSFVEGRSTIDLKANKATLFAKGYLSLYNDLNGKSVTGNVIRIYSS